MRSTRCEHHVNSVSRYVDRVSLPIPVLLRAHSSPSTYLPYLRVRLSTATPLPPLSVMSISLSRARARGATADAPRAARSGPFCSQRSIIVGAHSRCEAIQIERRDKRSRETRPGRVIATYVRTIVGTTTTAAVTNCRSVLSRHGDTRGRTGRGAERSCLISRVSDTTSARSPATAAAAADPSVAVKRSEMSRIAVSHSRESITAMTVI